MCHEPLAHFLFKLMCLSGIEKQLKCQLLDSIENPIQSSSIHPSLPINDFTIQTSHNKLLPFEAVLLNRKPEGTLAFIVGFNVCLLLTVSLVLAKGSNL